MAILDRLCLDYCDYLLSVDADTTLGSGSIERIATALRSNKSVAAVAGMVLVPFKNFGFWNMFQGFQYYYGQVVRRATESLWGKVTCLPGAITMVNTHHPAVQAACECYSKLPSSNFLFQIKNRLQGTDRRLTNSIFQHSNDTHLVLDKTAHCYTVPPQSLVHFRSQRTRWISNVITGNWYLLVGTNVPLQLVCSVLSI